MHRNRNLVIQISLLLSFDPYWADIRQKAIFFILLQVLTYFLYRGFELNLQEEVFGLKNKGIILNSIDKVRFIFCLESIRKLGLALRFIH